MKTRTRKNRNLVTWSGLPPDLVGSIFSLLSLADFHHAKLVCRNWSSSCKLAVTRKLESPWLILFPKGENGCMLYNPDEDKVYKSLRDFSGTRFLANLGKWFLMVDSRTNLYIIDIFSEKRIDLPPLEYIRLSKSTITRIGDQKFIREETISGSPTTLTANYLKGLLWVDENTEDYVVVWYFYSPVTYLTYCRKGDGYYTDIPLCVRVPKLLEGCTDVVLRGYRLYISTIRREIRIMDLSGQKGFVDVTGSKPSKMLSPLPSCEYHSKSYIVVTMAGEVLMVERRTLGEEMSYHIYKKDPSLHHLSFSKFHAVDSLGDEAVLFDLGITVPSNHTLGIKPNSIYFTRHGRAVPSHLRKPACLDICVFNLETNTFKRFPALDNMNLKDARWLLPMT